jgi:hypothetical protein
MNTDKEKNEDLADMNPDRINSTWVQFSALAEIPPVYPR